MLSIPEEHVRLLVLVDVLLVWKMWAVGNYTSFLRISRKVFATPEDYAMNGVPVSSERDEAVERSRRAHLNDLENILPFFVLSALFAATHPSYTTLATYLWVFTAARTLHSLFYLCALQPYRSIAFAIGAVTSFAMSVQLLLRAL